MLIYRKTASANDVGEATKNIYVLLVHKVPGGNSGPESEVG